MRNRWIGMIVLVIAVLVFSPGMQAQTAPPSGAAKAIPNLSGLWESPPDPTPRPRGTELCANGGCRAALGLPPAPEVSKNLEEPQMLPWAEQQYKTIRQGSRNANGNPPRN